MVLAASLIACGDSRDQSFASAKSDVAAGNSTSAIIRLRSLLQSDPNFAEGRLLLGQVLLETGEAAAAEQELRRAFEAGIDTDVVKPLLARSLLEIGSYPRVLSDFPPQQIRSPQARADVLVSQAYAQLFMGQVDGAKASVREANAASPDSPRAAIASALIRSAEGDHAGAAPAIDAVLARQPNSAEALRAKASIAQGKGDLPSAIQALQTLAKLRPTDIAAQYRAVMLLWQSGKVDEAKAQLESMKEAAKEHPRTAHLQALMALHDRDLPAARDFVALALKNAPEFTPSLLLAGIIHAELGDYEVAEGFLNKVVAADPRNLAAQLALVGIYQRTQRASRALALGQELLARAPDQPRVLLAVATAYLQAGESKKAQALFEKAAALGVKGAPALTGLALAQLASGDSSKATEVLFEASAADHSRIEADALLVNYYVGRKEYDRALQVLATIASKRPGDGRVFIVEGEILSHAGRKAEARAAYERAYELRPDILMPLIELGRLDLAEGKQERARQRFEEASKRRPKDASILLAYADWLHESKAEPDVVRATVEKAVQLAPDKLATRLSLIAFHTSRRDLAAAISAAEQGLQVLPNNERLLTVLADLQSRAGKPEQAAATLAKAVQVSPQSPDLLVRLADVQLASGAVEAAKDSLRKAKSVRPGYRPAMVRLVALEQPTGSPAEIVEAARELQQSQPNDPIGYFLEARVFAQQKKWADAIRVLRGGLDKAKSPQLVIALHSALVGAGKAEEAGKLAADWVRTYPKDSAVRRYLADRALANKDYAAAVRLYKEIVVDFPNDAQTLNGLAWAAGRAGDPMALEYAERAHRQAPDDANILDTLGWILVERGELARGTELLKRATAAAPGAGETRLHLAKALLKSGDQKAARRELETLARLGDKFPSQVEVKQLLAGL